MNILFPWQTTLQTNAYYTVSRNGISDFITNNSLQTFVGLRKENDIWIAHICNPNGHYIDNKLYFFKEKILESVKIEVDNIIQKHTDWKLVNNNNLSVLVD